MDTWFVYALIDDLNVKTLVVTVYMSIGAIGPGILISLISNVLIVVFARTVLTVFTFYSFLGG